MKKIILLLAVLVFTLTLGLSAFAAPEPGIDNGITAFSTSPVAMDNGSIDIQAASSEQWRSPDTWSVERESYGSAAGGMRDEKVPYNGVTYFGSAPLTNDLLQPDNGVGNEAPG